MTPSMLLVRRGSSVHAIDRLRPWLTAAVAITALYVLGYLWAFVGRPWGERGTSVLSDFGEVPLECLGVLLWLLVVTRDLRARARTAWSLIALAVAANLIANVIYGAYDLAGEQPFPSVADAFYLAFYPLLLGGLLMLPTATERRDLFEWRVWSNVAIVMLGGGMALIHFVLLPTVAQLPGEPVSIVVSLAYPAGDLALLAALATVASRRPYHSDRAAITSFIVAVIAWFLADLAFAIESASGGYTVGGPADVLWLAADVGFILAAQGQLLGLPRADAAHAGTLVPLGRLGGYLMLGLGLATLVAAAVTTQAEIAFLALLAVTLTVLVVVRQLIDERERRRAEAALLAEQAAAAERAAMQARRDPLTGLPNRAAFHEVLAASMEAARLAGHPLSLAYLDLDLFKSVNDTLGHAAGDRLLVEVGTRLSRCTRSGDTVARLGGDEFALILPGAPAGAALRLAEHAKTEVERPVAVGTSEVVVGVSVGLSTYPDSGATDGDALVHQADSAMYRAKRARLGPTIWDPTVEEASGDLTLVAQLRETIAGESLILHFQPIRETASSGTVAFEALVRWPHPERGLLAPAEFLPLAASIGLMRELDTHVLALACAQARAWLDRGLRPQLCVNVTRDTVGDRQWRERVAKALAQWGVPGEILVFEVSEDGLLGGPEDSRRFVEEMHALGAGVAIDDFGTGFSSLARLHELPADLLKIDRGFVSRVASDPQDAAIVEAVVHLGHRLGMKVVAEGVEDEAGLAWLDARGADFSQGFWISPPLTAEAATERLERERALGLVPAPAERSRGSTAAA